MARKKIDLSIFIKAIEGSGGNISLIQQRLAKAGIKVSRDLIYRRLDDFPSLCKQYEEEKERILDCAEGVLEEQIKEGNWKVALEYLERIGKQRGWSKESNVNLQIPKNVKIVINTVKKNGKRNNNGSD